VIINRVRKAQEKGKPASICSIVSAPGQFDRYNNKNDQRARIHVLGSARGDAVLPSRPGAVAFVLRWLGVGGGQAQPPWNRCDSRTLDALVRECSSAVAVCSNRYSTFCWTGVGRSHRSGGLKFKKALLSLDSTVIDLCAIIFEWAKFRTAKGGVKIHMLLDNQGLLPSYALINRCEDIGHSRGKGDHVFSRRHRRFRSRLQRLSVVRHAGLAGCLIRHTNEGPDHLPRR
jgi:hypothetical protein